MPASTADLSQLGKLFDFNSPPFVVGEMKMKPVQFIKRHEVDQLLHSILRLEVACDIQMQPSITKARGIGDSDAVDRYLVVFLAIAFDRQQASQRLCRIKHARGIRSL